MNNVLGSHSLAASILSGVVSSTVNFTVVGPGVGETPPNPSPKHGSSMLISCTAQLGALVTTPGIVIPDGFAQFPATQSVNSSTGSATMANCSAVVRDTDPNAATNCTLTPAFQCGNPDVYDSHAPIGTITWTWPGGPPGGTTCNLVRLDVYTASQRPNQTPFASACQVGPFTTSGSGTGGQITASYTGSTHANTTSNVPVNFP
jgi:hypothetical protein